MQNKRTWLFLILLLILFSLIVAQQQQINDLRDDLTTVQEQSTTLEKKLTEHITPPLPAENYRGPDVPETVSSIINGYPPLSDASNIL